MGCCESAPTKPAGASAGTKPNAPAKKVEEVKKVNEVPKDATWKIDTVPDGGVLVLAHPGSGNAIPLMILGLKHMGSKYKMQFVDIVKSDNKEKQTEQFSPDFLAVNPFHAIPAIKCSDGTGMFESLACLVYMAKKYAPELYGDDKREFIDMALCCRQTEIYPAWQPLGYHIMGFAPKPEPKAGALLDERLAQYEKAFLAAKFIGGASPCIADYFLLPFINTLSQPVCQKLGYSVPQRWATWFNDMKEALGDIYEEAHKVHNGWIGGNVEKMEQVTFEKFGGLPSGKGDWKAEEPPADGFIMYNTAPSPNAVPIRLVGAKFMGDKYKYQECSIFPGKEEQMSADFLAINPFHHIPSGKCADGAPIFESSVMLRHLGRKFAPALYPEDKQGMIDVAIEVRENTFVKLIKSTQYHVMGFSPEPPTADDIAKLNDCLATLEKVFLKKKFFCGDEVTLADLMFIGNIHLLAKNPSTEKLGYQLPARWQTFHDDVKAWAGDDMFVKACEGLDGMIAAGLEKVKPLAK